MREQIRKMEPADAASLAILEKECFSSPWSQKDILDTYYHGQSLFIVACQEEKILGYLGMTYAADEGEITNIAVFSEYRRRGIAEKILNFLFEEAKKTGLSMIFLDVRVSNVPAISLYKKMGFENCGIRKGFYDYPKEDAYIFRRDL